MVENQTRPVDKPLGGWRHLVQICSTYVIIALILVAVLVAVAACFLLPGPLKVICVVPWFFLAILIGESKLFEACVFTAIFSAASFCVYYWILSAIETAATHQ
jgi:hypothetical protein